MFLKLINPVYQFGSQVKKWAFQSGFLETQKLECKVVSIGNISFGGTGKTPMIQYFVENIFKDKKIVVVCKSYSGNLQAPQAVELTTAKIFGESARVFGDEPVLLKILLPEVSVWSGPEKWNTARVAQQKENPDLILVDDGFSHFKLHRDLDIVLVDATQFYNELRREFFTSLSRAQIVILTKTNLVAADTVSKIKSEIESQHGHLKNFIYTSEIEIQLDADPTKPLYLFCGVAHPQSVADSLVSLGFKVVQIKPFSDHFYYSDEDQLALVLEIEKFKLKFPDLIVVTTTKDLTKLSNPQLVAQIKIIQYKIVFKENEKRALLEKIRNTL